MTLVTNLFPVGMVGMVMAVLTAALVSTVGSALNALSTVFTIDIYMKYRPKASEKEMISVGRLVTVVGAIISIVICIAIDSIKGLDLFNVFQSVLGFIAPPMAAVFLFGVFWKGATTRAANFALTFGTAFSLLVGVSLFVGLSFRGLSRRMASFHDAFVRPLCGYQCRHVYHQHV